MLLIILCFAFMGGCGQSNIRLFDRYIPKSGTTWQWQLSGKPNISYNVELYDLDLFDTPKELIEQLHNEGKRVICYFSAGTYEPWRADAKLFEPAVLGRRVEGWEEERWLDIRKRSVVEIMLRRLDLARQKGCDGVEPDNVDGYLHDTGFALSYEDQLRFNRTLAKEAHKRGLAIGLKNDLEQIPDLARLFDFAINEQCHEFEECDLLMPFIEEDKAVFNAEYAQKYVESSTARKELCEDARRRGFSTLVLPVELDDSFRFSCQEE